jgi:N-hydroxyarylamine O-acetyltransferase
VFHASADFDLDAYLARIGLSGGPSLAEVHRAHVVSIPFENLDPQRGMPVSLEDEALQRKLVTERRGGYCFEQNLLLAGALAALGAEVELLLARVRMGAPRDAPPRPRSHLLLRVQEDGAIWHADAGFGAGTLLEPIPFGPGVVHDQSGWRFRVVQDDRELVLQSAVPSGWIDLYAFVPEEVPRVDLETSNWFTCTHPRSPFVTGMNVVAHRPDGSRVSLSDWSELAFTEQSPERLTVTPVEREQIPALLETEFGLPGWALDPDGCVVRPSV